MLINIGLMGEGFMSYTYQKLPGEAILILSFSVDHHIKLDDALSIEEGVKLLDAEAKPVFFIVDLSNLAIGFEDVVAGASVTTKQFKFLGHPKVREALIVTQSRLISLAAKGLDSVAFGHVKVKSFETRDAAMAYARKAG